MNSGMRCIETSGLPALRLARPVGEWVSIDAIPRRRCFSAQVVINQGQRQ
jgi:hypothetical protein